MKNVGLEIEYGDIAHNAKENFVPNINQQFKYSNIKQLQEYNLNVNNYGNPCETYSFPLNGKMSFYPDEKTENLKTGYISKEISKENYIDGIGYEFNEPITITFETSNGQYTSNGLTLWFDNDNNIFPTKIKVQFYQDDSLLFEMDGQPTAPVFTFADNVKEYNKIVIITYALNTPQNRLKIRSLDYGYGTKFSGSDAVDAKIYQKINPTMAELIANSATGYIRESAFSYYKFFKNNLLKIYFDDQIKQVVYISEIKTTNDGTYQIKGDDVVVLLDSFLSDASTLNVGNFSIEYIKEMLASENIKTVVNENVQTAPTRTGSMVNKATFRNVVNELIFAGTKNTTLFDTSDSEFSTIRTLDNNISQKIPLTRQTMAPEIKQDEIVESISLSYKQRVLAAIEGEYKRVLRKVSPISGAGISPKASYIAKADKPVYKWRAAAQLEVEGGEVIELTNIEIIDDYTAKVYATNKNNYWLFSVNVYAMHYNYQTIDRTLVEYNENVDLRNAAKTSISIRSNIVLSDNAQNIMDKCKEWYFKNGELRTKIVEGKHIVGGEPIKWGQKKWGSFKYGQKTEKQYIYDKPVRIGDVIEVEINQDESYVGRIFSQEYTCDGGILIKEVGVK